MDGPASGLDHLRVRVADPAAACRALTRAGFAASELDVGHAAVIFLRDHLEIGRGDVAAAELEMLALADAPLPDREPTHIRQLGAVRFAETDLGGAPALPLAASRALTPANLRTPAALRHANGAVGIAGLTIVTRAPAAAASSLPGVLGSDALTRTDGIVAARIGAATLLLATWDDAEALHPDLVVDPETVGSDAPLAVALSIEVARLDRTVAVLEAGELPFRRRPDGSLGLKLAALGLSLEFRETA